VHFQFSENSGCQPEKVKRFGEEAVGCLREYDEVAIDQNVYLGQHAGEQS
jgi:hypothetical protein